MPLINGIKMACEPCIRGHRSTKCTHANERLMVPVKKPGRPLSECPHLDKHLCGCSSVTAAIPRKQKCHCATDASVGPPPVQSYAVTSANPDVSSSTKVTFQAKSPSASSRPDSRKQSYDPSNLERMDPSNANIIPFQNLASETWPGQTVRDDRLASTKSVQCADDLQDSRPSAEIQDPCIQLEMVDLASSGGSSCFETSSEIRNGQVPGIAQMNGITDSGSVASSTDVPMLSVVSSIPSGRTAEISKSNGHSETKQHPPPIEHSISQDACEMYIPQTTTCPYPTPYGSYQHPLQPWEWRNTSNMYAQPMPRQHMLNMIASNTLPIPETLLTCNCGDSCQCIGCAAHPYNAATQNYVRSAYNMAHKPSTSANTEYVNGYNNGTVLTSTADTLGEGTNGDASSHRNGEQSPPPTVETPPDTSMAEEQTLPTLDYFFVNYPFLSECCDGDTISCPCGDDCECVGCVMRRFDPSITALPSDLRANKHTPTSGDGIEFL